MSPGVTPGPKGRVGVILSYPRAAEWNVSALDRLPSVRSPHRWTTRLSPPPQKLANSITFRPISVVSWTGSVMETVFKIAKLVFGVFIFFRASPFTRRYPFLILTPPLPPGLVQNVRVPSPWGGGTKESQGARGAPE